MFRIDYGSIIVSYTTGVQLFYNGMHKRLRGRNRSSGAAFSLPPLRLASGRNRSNHPLVLEKRLNL